MSGKKVRFMTMAVTTIFVFPIILTGCQFDSAGLPASANSNNSNGVNNINNSNNTNDGTDPCEGVQCGEHGTCVVISNSAECQCDRGYIYDGSTCSEIHTTPCAGVDCDGHGTCVIEDGKAECRCDRGYTAEATHCIADATDACDGVDCGGHGTCVVNSGDAVCLCDNGYINDSRDALVCIDAVQCTADYECDTGLLCSADGVCVSPQCGLPPSQNGNRTAYESCTPDSVTSCNYCNNGECTMASCLRCSSGLVCVPFGQPINPYYPEATGICMPACNPCNRDVGDCDTSQTCFPLSSSGGGVCLDSNTLSSTGQPCAASFSSGDDNDETPEMFMGCTSDLECVYDASLISSGRWYCRKPCTPDTTLTDMDVYYQASTSSDCSGNEVCAGAYVTGDAIIHFECMTGYLVTDEDNMCGRVGSSYNYCQSPMECYKKNGEVFDNCHNDDWK